MEEAGINIATFKAHSVRGASTAAAEKGVIRLIGVGSLRSNGSTTTPG